MPTGRRASTSTWPPLTYDQLKGAVRVSCTHDMYMCMNMNMNMNMNMCMCMYMCMYMHRPPSGLL